jgi:hypothetical protein
VKAYLNWNSKPPEQAKFIWKLWGFNRGIKRYLDFDYLDWTFGILVKNGFTHSFSIFRAESEKGESFLQGITLEIYSAYYLLGFK